MINVLDWKTFKFVSKFCCLQVKTAKNLAVQGVLEVWLSKNKRETFDECFIPQES